MAADGSGSGGEDSTFEVESTLGNTLSTTDTVGNTVRVIQSDDDIDAESSLSVPALTLTDRTTSQRDEWRAEIAEIGGRSALLHFDDTSRSRIDLSTPHPGGLASFMSGNRTMLSSLVRESFAWRTAIIAADAIVTRSRQLQSARSLDAVNLGVVIATWSFGGEDFTAPVLLRPLNLRRHGSDFELTLGSATRVNPEFVAAMAAQFGVEIDAPSLVAAANGPAGFTPNAVIDTLRYAASGIEGFAVQPRLVVSTFADVAAPMVRDAAKLAHPVLDALAGNAAAIETVRESYAPVEPIPSDERSPQTDSLVLDADAEQEAVIAQITAGNSVVVRTMPGTGATQTIVNAIGSLVAQNKRVLVVGSRRASLRSIAQRFESIGLGGVAVDPRSIRRDLIRGITRNEKAERPDLAEVDDALLRLRSVIRDYRGALDVEDRVLGVSALQCVRELAALASGPRVASTTARLPMTALEALSSPRERERVVEVLAAAARFGEFRYGPGDSPWYGAQFATSVAAERAHAVAKRLAHDTLPPLLERATEMVDATAMRPFTSIDELGVYLRLLVDLRDTLDKFQPSVFDRSVRELIAATAPKRDNPNLSPGDRRRLKKLALEYVRPGARVTDLHEALVKVQKQRVLWHRFVAEGSSPQVPPGLSAVQTAYQSVRQDLDELDGPLGRTERDRQLAHLPIWAVREQVDGLAADSEVLHNLQERTALMASLRVLDLDGLIDDLATRHVPDSDVAAEVELAWWKSALQSMLERDRALLGANTEVLDRLEADFRIVDEAHAQSNAGALAWQLAENWSIGIVDWPDEAQALKTMLRAGEVTSTQLQSDAPHLTRWIAPVWLASTYDVPLIDEAMPFDVVLLVDAGATRLVEHLGAIRRGRQVVAVGDPVTQTPTPFEIAVRPNARATVPTADELAARHADSTFAQLASLLPTLRLTQSYRAGGEDLAELVNSRFYGGDIVSLPWAGTFLGHDSVRFDYVEGGVGVPDPTTGAVESPDAEVSRVVELVIDHATRRPAESLMVVTPSQSHATRVMSSVLAAVAGTPELVAAIVAERSEPFEVLTIEQAAAVSRDRVIFSVGFGRTPHGRVLSDFGALGVAGGERQLAVAMTSARRGLTIVSSVQSSDIPERARYGVRALGDILEWLPSRVQRRSSRALPDPMVADLARRLQARGLIVEVSYRGLLPLVAANGGRCAVIETDDEVLTSSLRESLRLRPAHLRRLGWHYARVHAFELFTQPDAVADRIAVMLGVDLMEVDQAATERAAIEASPLLALAAAENAVAQDPEPVASDTADDEVEADLVSALREEDAGIETPAEPAAGSFAEASFETGIFAADAFDSVAAAAVERDEVQRGAARRATSASIATEEYSVEQQLPLDFDGER